MTAERWSLVIGLVAWLLIAGAGLARRRLGVAAYLRLALLWAGIILGTWALVRALLDHGYFT